MIEAGSFVQRYVYGTAGENIASDFASEKIEKVWYCRSLLDSSLFAVDAESEVVMP